MIFNLDVILADFLLGELLTLLGRVGVEYKSIFCRQKLAPEQEG
jgi:hypothetical protein